MGGEAGGLALPKRVAVLRPLGKELPPPRGPALAKAASHLAALDPQPLRAGLWPVITNTTESESGHRIRTWATTGFQAQGPGPRATSRLMLREVVSGRRCDLRTSASRGQRCGGECAARRLEFLPDASSESHWLWLEPRGRTESSTGASPAPGTWLLHRLSGGGNAPGAKETTSGSAARGHELSSQALQPIPAPPGDQANEDCGASSGWPFSSLGYGVPVCALVWVAPCELRFLLLCLFLGQVTSLCKP